MSLNNNFRKSDHNIKALPQAVMHRFFGTLITINLKFKFQQTKCRVKFGTYYIRNILFI